MIPEQLREEYVNLRRKQTDRQLAAISHNGNVHEAKDGRCCMNRS